VIVWLLVLILLALLIPGFMRAALSLALVLGLVIFVAALFEAGDMHREQQLRDPGSPMSRELRRQTEEAR